MRQKIGKFEPGEVDREWQETADASSDDLAVWAPVDPKV